MDYSVLSLDLFQHALGIALQYWWIWLPLGLCLLLIENLEHHSKIKYLSELKWVLIEIKIPRDSHKSLRAMEQVFSALHAIPGAGKPPKTRWDKFKAWRDKILKGKIPDWLSLEIVSIGGDIHFYIRTLESHRHIIQAQLYAHYSEAELAQVSDYLAQFPAQAPSEEYDITGTELGLEKEDAFPIRTYLEFDEKGAGKDDIRRIDPLAPLTEALNALQLGEYLAIQYLIRSTGDGWVKSAQKQMDKIYEKPEKPRNDGLDKFAAALDSGISAVANVIAPVEVKKEEKKEEKKEGKTYGQLSPGMQEVVKAMEASFAKLAFETGIRIIYTARKDRYVKERIPAVMAAFKLFSSPALNGFKSAYSPDVKKGRKKVQQTAANKEMLYNKYRNREFPEKPFVLNTEEITTIYHFPDVSVHTPTLPRIEAKKGEPPAGLPIV